MTKEELEQLRERFEEVKPINGWDLWNERLSHHSYIAEFSSHLAKEASLLKEMKRDAKKVRSMIFLKTIEEASKKPSDEVLRQTVENDQTVDDAERKCFEQESVVKEIEGMVESLKDRGYGLRDLVQLHLRSYTASNIEGAAMEIDEESKETMERIRQKVDEE